MNSKTFKKLTIFLFVIFSFFGFSSPLKAYQTGAVYAYPSGFKNVQFTLNGVNKKLNYATGIYMVDGMQAYCIEPGVSLPSAGFSGNLSLPIDNFDIVGTID